MTWYSWLITIVPVALIIVMGFYASKFIRGAADYLAAGRCAGRYVISIGDMQAYLGLVVLVAMVEGQYQSGLAISFWNGLIMPIGMVLSLTGYCAYRFRETRSLSIGQFLELRYSRSFRIFASGLRTLSEMLCNSIGPIVAARFFIYFLGIPNHIDCFGVTLPTYALLMLLVLLLALLIIIPGGRISLLVTDCLQGLMSYPIFVIFTVFFLTKISFINELAPLLNDRVAGESFLNPYDLEKLRDFNLFALFVTIFSLILNRASWYGGDANVAGRTPHESKMAGILGVWKNGFSGIMCVLVGTMVFGIMNHSKFVAEAGNARVQLISKAADELITAPDKLTAVSDAIKSYNETAQPHQIGINEPMSREVCADARYLNVVQTTLNGGETDSNALEAQSEGNSTFQKIRTIYYQMLMPVALQQVFSPFLMGIFCLLMVLLMISTDTSRIFSASSTLVQDVIMPLRSNPFKPEEHIRYLRLCSLFVCAFFFVVSLYMDQIDFIQMFTTITTSIWLGGAGPVMVFGLYSRFGNKNGAWASLLIGAGISVTGIIMQQIWASHTYPFLVRMDWLDNVSWFLETISAPLNPIIEWKMDAAKFPINSQEIYCTAMFCGIVGYIVFSLMTFKTPFNLDRMLHRGIYDVNHDHNVNTLKSEETFGSKLYQMFVGITPEYSRGDRILTWSVVIYTIGYQFVICFIGIILWNAISPLSTDVWKWYFYLNIILIPGIIGVITTIWFLIGGTIDLRQMFRDLAARKEDTLDDGWVEGNVSAADQKRFAELEKDTPKE